MVIEEYMVWIWLVIFLIAIVIESLTQDLIAIWFGFGGLITLIISAVPNVPWYIELVIFALVSLFLMALTRPFVKRLLQNAMRYTNIDEFVGRRVKVLTEITKYENGEVKLNDIIYHASLLEEENEPIQAGEIVEVVTFKGNKVVVRKINKEGKEIKE